MGRYHGEDQHHTAIVKEGEKILEILYFEELGVRRIIAPLADLRYFKEIANSDEHLARMKSAAQRYLKKSPITGLKREMTLKARGVLEEIVNL